MICTESRPPEGVGYAPPENYCALRLAMASGAPKRLELATNAYELHVRTEF